MLLCLLLDHGLRASEAALLQGKDVDLQARTLEFYRPKVDQTKTHELTDDSWSAAWAYLEQDARDEGPLLSGSLRSGKLSATNISPRAITDRVRVLGERIGLAGLSAHDCRHYRATQAARGGTPFERLQEAGGWKSYAMPLRYFEAARIANEGVKPEAQDSAE